LIALVLLLATPPSGHGGESPFPIPSYDNEGLAKVRAWEKEWAGKKVDPSNVDQVADLLPKGYLEALKNPEKWGGKPIWFKIVPYRQVMPTKGFTEATRKNGEQITMDERMAPVGYEALAGFPFPEPKTGWEVAWNYDFNNGGDVIDSRTQGVQVDPMTGADRGSIIRNQTAWFASRTEVSPKPRVPDQDNPRMIRRSSLATFEHPQSMAGSRIMNYRYLDFSKDDESYMWMAEFRRVRRVVASQKQDTHQGMYRANEDRSGYNNHIITSDYKLQGRRELLVARHGDPAEWLRVPGQYVFNGVERERVNTYVVEVVSKDSPHIYSKRIWYVDPEDFYIKWIECYDRDGKLWRLLENQYGVEKNVNGEGISFPAGTTDLDWKEMAAATTFRKPLALSGTIEMDLFTLGGMAKGAY
jgi:hypothetical protein